MISVKDISGNIEPLTGYKSIKRIRKVNGEKTIAFLIYPNETNKIAFDMVKEESIIEFNGDEYRIKLMNERSKAGTFYKEVAAIHTFFDLIDSYQYETDPGTSLTFQDALTFVLGGTGYTWSVIDTFLAQSFDNFGDDNRLALFNKIVERFGAEFTISGTNITFKKKIGNITDFQFRYNYNVKTISREVRTENLSTYIKGFGGPGITAEYTSPNADIFGIRHAKPVKDERYTTTEGLLQRLKNEIIDNPEISITMDFVDLRGAGFPYDVANEGDEVFLIYEPMSLDLNSRIVEIEETFSEMKEHPINTIVVLANLRDNISKKFTQGQKRVNDIFDGNGAIRYDALDAAVRRATEALQSAQTELEFTNGIIARDKTNPNNLVLLNSNGIGLSNDGGATFREAVTSDGFALTAGAIGQLEANNIKIGQQTTYEPGFDPSDINNDLKLTKAELNTIQNEVNNIKTEQTALAMDAQNLRITAELTAASNAVTALDGNIKSMIGNYGTEIKNKKTKAMWLWWAAGLTNQDEILRQLRKNYFNEIYLTYTNDMATDAEYKAFIKKCHSFDIEVHALSYDAVNNQAIWGYPESNAYLGTNWINTVINYNNAAAADEKFDAIQVDVEPYVLDAWNTDRKNLLLSWAANSQTWADQAAAAGITFGASLPFWLDDTTLDDLVQPEITRPYYQHMIDIFDYVALMSYDDNPTNQIEYVRNEIEYVTTTKILAGFETLDLGVSEDYQTYFEEGIAALEDGIFTVDNHYSNSIGYKGVAVHHWDSWKNHYATVDDGKPAPTFPIDITEVQRDQMEVDFSNVTKTKTDLKRKINLTRGSAARNLVNNFSSSNSLDQWETNGIGALIQKDVNGVIMPVLEIKVADTQRGVNSKRFEINPENPYEISILMASDSLVGTDYLGIRAYDINGTRLSIKTITPDLTYSADTQYAYLFEGQNDPINTWTERIGLIVPDSFDDEYLRDKGQNIHANAKMPANTHTIEILFLNLGNGAVTDSLWIANPNVTEVIPADQLRRDLNLAAPLPTYLTMGNNGITATATNGGMARLDYRGLYVRGGAIQIEGGIPEQIKKVRYIRDWVQGSSANDGNHWVEIEAISGGTNIALNKAVTCYESVAGGLTSYVTNGKTDTAEFLSVRGNTTTGEAYVTVDLGAVYDNIEFLVIYHYHGDGRSYKKTKTAISEDGVTWFVVADSATGGEYKETAKGRVIPLNMGQSMKRMTYIDQNGIYTGTFVFDQGYGGTLKLGGTNNVNGQLIIEDGGNDAQASFTENGGYIRSLAVDDFKSDQVAYQNKWGYYLYVDPVGGNDTNTGTTWATAFKSLQVALDSIPKVNFGFVTILMHSTNSRDVDENIVIHGFTGKGTIIIDFQTTANVLNGYIQIMGNTNGVTLKRVTIKSNTVDSSVYISRSLGVVIDNVIAHGNSISEYGVRAEDSSVKIANSKFWEHKYYAISADSSSRIFCYNNDGLSNDTGLVGINGGTIRGYGTAPAGKKNPKWETNGGQVISTFTYPSTPTTTPPPTTTPTTYTAELTATAANNWNESSNWWSNDGPKQGNYGYGRRAGFWFFGTKFSVLVGKTIKSASVYVTRASKGGVYNTAPIQIRWHGYETQPATPADENHSAEYVQVDLNAGSGAWVTIPSSFYPYLTNGTAKGIGCYIASDAATDYAVMSSSATFKVTYS